MNLNLKRTHLSIIATFLLCLLGGYLLWFRPYSSEVAADSNARLLLEIYSSGQSAYFAGHDGFTSDLNDLGVDVKLEGVQLYIDTLSIPNGDRSLIPADRLPFISRDKYRALAVTSNMRTGRKIIWTVDETRKLEKVQSE